MVPTFEENSDEYEPEVETILPRLGTASSVAEVRQVVHEEFVKWFDRAIAGPATRYDRVAERLWSEVVPGLRRTGR